MSPHSLRPHAFWWNSQFLDAHRPQTRLWLAILAGAALGLTWGVASRIWMRLISTEHEFSVFGTTFILAVPTVFGAFAGLAFAARRRGWRRWAHYVPRVLVVVTFIPFGTGAGSPMFATILLATLAVTQPANFFTWAFLGAVAILAALVAGSAWIAAGLGLAVLLAAIAWKLLAARRKAGNPGWPEKWLPRIAAVLLLIPAAAAFAFVSWEIVSSKFGPLAPLYVLMYVALIYPLFLGLRIGLEPKYALAHEPISTAFAALETAPHSEAAECAAENTAAPSDSLRPRPDASAPAGDASAPTAPAPAN